jgi:hypothetical protein
MAWYNQYFGGTTTPSAPTTGGNRPPTEREDRRDEPLVSVDYTAPTVDTSQPVETGDGLDLSWATGSTAEQQAQIEADIALAGTGGGSQYSGTGSPYFTSGYPDALFGSTVIPEHKAITNPSDMMIGNLLAYELSKDPKYTKEFYDPDSPYIEDAEGNMILDSSGNPIFTGFGKEMVDEFQANWDPSNPMDITLPGVFKEMAGDIIGKEKDYYTQREEEAWDPWSDPWGQPQQYGMFGSLADLAKHTWFSESLSDVEAREQARLDEGLGVATMANMEQMYGKEFAAQANPLYDPAFSLAATQEFDPGDIYGDLTLWQQAQKA